jgi:GNAT superfamily N-acetyltransferase
MEFKILESPDDWSAAIKLRNLVLWDSPISVAEALEWREDALRDGQDLRFVGVDDGDIVVYLALTEISNTDEKGRIRLGIYADPRFGSIRNYWKSGLDFAIDAARGMGAVTFQADSQSRNVDLIELLESYGFRKSMRFPVSVLELDHSFPIELPSDVQIVSYAEFRDANPDTWLHELWRIEMDVCWDLPLPFPFKETPYESFVEEILAPSIDLSTLFLALIDRKPVAMTQLFISKIDPRIVQTGLTGTRRDYRRRGIARLLKMHSANVVREMGSKTITTDNEEGNPMYLLNQELGFRYAYDNVSFEKPALDRKS